MPTDPKLTQWLRLHEFFSVEETMKRGWWEDVCETIETEYETGMVSCGFPTRRITCRRITFRRLSFQRISGHETARSRQKFQRPAKETSGFLPRGRLPERVHRLDPRERHRLVKGSLEVVHVEIRSLGSFAASSLRLPVDRPLADPREPESQRTRKPARENQPEN